MTTIPCECCGLTPVTPSVSNPSRHCKPCDAHFYSLDNLRTDHKKLAAALIDKHEKELARERDAVERGKGTLESLRAELDAIVKATGTDLASASEDALEALRGQAIFALQDEVRKAYYARNRAMDAVWTIDERHHAVMGEKCSCGLPLRACKEYRGLEFFRDEYQRWERKQIELMKAGKDHGLPANHPEALKMNTESRRWHGMRSTEPVP